MFWGAGGDEDGRSALLAIAFVDFELSKFIAKSSNRQTEVSARRALETIDEIGFTPRKVWGREAILGDQSCRRLPDLTQCVNLHSLGCEEAEVSPQRHERDTERLSRTRLPGAAVASSNLLASPKAKPNLLPLCRLCMSLVNPYFPIDGDACLRINYNITLSRKNLLQIPCRNRQGCRWRARLGAQTRARHELGRRPQAGP